MVKPMDLIDFKVCNLGDDTITFNIFDQKKVFS